VHGRREGQFADAHRIGAWRETILQLVVVIQPPPRRLVGKHGLFEASSQLAAEQGLWNDIAHDVSRIVENPCRCPRNCGHDSLGQNKRAALKYAGAPRFLHHYGTDLASPWISGAAPRTVVSAVVFDG